jgi:hypothetical protein
LPPESAWAQWASVWAVAMWRSASFWRYRSGLGLLFLHFFTA